MPDIKQLTDAILAYDPDADTDRVARAFEFASEAHAGQKRFSGEDYIEHPFAIAMILADLQMDETTIIGGLLHDVAEDTPFTIQDIEDRFGKDVSYLVDGVTKIGKLEYNSKEQSEVETFRKMFVAMANDIRVIIIKLADRLHNMRTLSAMRPDKQKQKSRETLDIYAPIAHRLGIFKMKMEFEDLAFYYLEPDAYRDLENKIAMKKPEQENYINNIISILNEKMEKEKIKCSISGRSKHYYSIYKKMLSGREFDEIYDLMAVRIIVESVSDCYAALGWVHMLWKPIPGRIKDYIAMPKPNMYQSLHTTVIGPGGTPFEIQIRTEEMHRVAEYGVAAHWKYKEGKKGADELAEKLNFLSEIRELEMEAEASDDFVESVKNDLYTDEVFVFTPKGKVIELPAGSTPIDFAYRVHTEVGNKCSGAKVNGKIVPLTYILQTGDIVEIITNPQSKGPSRDWLKVVVTPSARNKIRAFFRKADRDENIMKGKEAFRREAKHYETTYDDLVKKEYENFVFKRFNVASWDDLFSVIGYGGLRAGYIIQRIKENFKEDFATEKTINIVKAPTKKNSTVIVQGHDDLEINFARCCSPVPGDPIMGYITRGRGITVHRADCMNIKNSNETARLISVSWPDTRQDEIFTAELVIRAIDRKGLLIDISTIIAGEGINISGLKSKSDDDGYAMLYINIVIRNVSQITTVMNKLDNVPNIISVNRV